jgi:hypothetical protein
MAAGEALHYFTARVAQKHCRVENIAHHGQLVTAGQPEANTLK